jgi:hypothetical protein
MLSSSRLNHLFTDVIGEPTRTVRTAASPLKSGVQLGRACSIVATLNHHVFGTTMNLSHLRVHPPLTAFQGPLVRIHFRLP